MEAGGWGYKATLCVLCAKCTDIRLCGFDGKLRNIPKGAEYEERHYTDHGEPKTGYRITSCPDFERGRARSAEEKPKPLPEPIQDEKEPEEKLTVREAARLVEIEVPEKDTYIRKYTRYRNKEYDELRIMLNIMECVI